MNRVDVDECLGCSQAFTTHDALGCGSVTWGSVLMEAAPPLRVEDFCQLYFILLQIHPSPYPFLSLGFLSISSIIWPSRGKSPSDQTPTRKWPTE